MTLAFRTDAYIDGQWRAGARRFRVYNPATQDVIAEVPELPGCAADGATYQEALANVQIIITEWIETAQEMGRAIPQPKGRLMFA